MASPAAILNILVQASTAQAITDLTKMEGASRRTFQSGSAAAAKYSTSVADATRKATGAVERLSLAQQRAALGVEAAQTKATVATQRYGAESLQARTAAVRLAEAQRKSSVAAVDLSAAQKRVIEAQAGVVAGMGRVDSATAHTAQQTEHFHTRMRKSWHGVTTSATGYVSALVGVAGVVEGMKKSVEASGTLEVAQGQLRQTVKTADITWRAHSKQLEDYVVAARKAKGFTDVDLEKSLTGNIRTTKSVAEAQKLTTAAMDVARAKGIDLYAAQQQLGRVFLGNTLAIRSLGIQFTPATRAQDALSASAESGNKKLKAQAKQLDANANRTAALAAIQKQYGGDARKYANSTQGQLAKFHANVDALEATVGNTMLPILAKLAEKGAEAATKIEEHWPQIKKDIGDVVRPVEHVAEAFFSFGKAHPQIAKLAGSLTIAALAVHKIDQHTGAFSLLAKVGKTALGGGGAAGGGIIAKITGKAAGAPVYVTNWEMIRGGGGGLPGKAESTGSKLLKAAPLAALGGVAGAAGFLGFKSVTDDDKAMNHFLQGVHDKLAAANAQIANVAPISAKAQHQLTGDFQKMDAAAGTSFGHIRTVLTGTMGDIEKTVGTKSLAAKIALSQNFSDAAGAIKASMHAGLISTKTGMSEINDLFKNELAQFGITGKSADRIAEVRASTQLTRTGHAMGGFIGQPGEKGGDTVPLSLPAGWAILTGAQQDALSYGLSRLGMASGGRVPIIAGRGEYAAGPDQLPMFDLAAKAAGFSGLDGLFASVNQPHYMSRGGSLAGVHAKVASAARTVLGRFPGLSVTSTTGGKHAPGSYHYLGEAVDLGGSPGVMNTAADWIKRTIGAGLTEGIHDPNLSIKQGKTVPASYWGSSVWQEHLNHIHMAIADSQSGVGGGAVPAGGMGGGAFTAKALPRVRYKGPGGMLGRIGQAAIDRARAAANSKLPGTAGDVRAASGSANVVAAFNRAIRSTGANRTEALALFEAGIVESGLRNLNYGDADSLGALQERTSIYGRAHALNPYASATRFLGQVKALRPWRGTPGALAQAAQRSRFPGRYDQVARRATPYVQGLFGGGQCRFAKGGFIGGRIAMAGGGDPIVQFKSHLHPKPPKAPKAGPKPPKPVEGLNPNNNQREWHTPAVWRDIRIRYQQAHHGQHAPVKPAAIIEDINPSTGRDEKHTAAQWHQIRLHYREHLGAIRKQDAAVARMTAIPSQGTAAQIALQTVENRGDLPGQLDIDRTLLGADEKQLRKINKALRNPKLSKRQRAGLLAGKLAVLQDIGSLKGDISSVTQSISDLSTPQSDPSLTDNTAAIEEQNKLLQQQLDISKQALDAANKFGAVSQSQYGALRAAVAEAANGVLGGRVGLGFATPSYPGKVANL